MLPNGFEEKMQALLGPEYEAFLQALDGPRHVGLRRNPRKPLEPQDLDFGLSPVPWEPLGHTYDPSCRPGLDPRHEAGGFYLQEPSAMAPVALLDPQPGERILDLCAAPGGKSTQIAGRLMGSGLLVCNEIHPKRAKILSSNLERLGIDPKQHDIRFVEDNWESPTLGAWGLGWEVWLDGMEITQFTYFQQVGSQDVRPVASEITYGLERLAMYIQGVENVYDIQWTDDYTYGDVFHQNEYEQSVYAFDLSDEKLLFDLFDKYEKEAVRIIEKGYVHPAYDYVLKCSHTFNLLDARGAISVSQRAAFIGRVRRLARLCAECYLKQREELGYPMLHRGEH